MESDDGVSRFTCPRCGAAAEASFYGPCAGCRAELVATQVAAGREVETSRFEPALHVVPNQVATKD